MRPRATPRIYHVLSVYGKVALPVAPEGITLGGLPYRHTRTTLVVPWQEIAAVVLHEQRVARVRNAPHVPLQIVERG